MFHSVHNNAGAGGGGHALLLGPPSSPPSTQAPFVVQRNIFVDTVYFAGFSVQNITFTNNHLVNAGTTWGTSPPTLVAHDNYWWGTTVRPLEYAGSGDIVDSDPNNSGLSTRCFPARRWTDPSFELCLDYAGAP